MRAEWLVILVLAMAGCGDNGESRAPGDGDAAAPGDAEEQGADDDDADADEGDSDGDGDGDEHDDGDDDGQGDPGAPAVHEVIVSGSAGEGYELFVAHVAAGNVVAIEALGGYVSFDNTDLGETCTYAVGPGGMPRAAYDQNQVLCYAEDWCSPDPVASANHAALYYLLGGAAAAVGAGVTVTASSAGGLSLGVNDCSPGNNSGSFSARVTIAP